MADTYETFVQDFYQPAYRFAYSLCCQYADAWDLTQQSFAIAQKRLHQLRDTAKGKQWLFTIIHREFLRTRRRETVRNEHAVEFSEPEDALLVEDHATRIDAQTMLLTFAQLEEHFRLPLALFYFDQLSYKEIAEVLAVPIGTVMSRLARGKALLRKTLEDQEADPTPQSGPVADGKKAPVFTVLPGRPGRRNGRLKGGRRG